MFTKVVSENETWKVTATVEEKIAEQKVNGEEICNRISDLLDASTGYSRTKAVKLLKAAPALLDALEENYEFTKYAAANKICNTTEYIEMFFQLCESAQEKAKAVIKLTE